jgi:hypothetical protein
VVDREEESNSVGFGVWKLFTSDVVEEMSKSKAAINRTSMCAALWDMGQAERFCELPAGFELIRFCSLHRLLSKLRECSQIYDRR